MSWLVVLGALLVAAFTVARPDPLPPPQLPLSFSRTTATSAATQLAGMYPDRTPGSPGALGAAQWFSDQLKPLGLKPQVDEFTATIPGGPAVRLRNVMAVASAPSSSAETIVVMAHRDNTGVDRGANDNASGTAALLELARTYARPTPQSGEAGGAVNPHHTLVFLSTDAGVFGGLGAERFLNHSGFRSRIVAVINLDALASTGTAHVEIGGDEPRSPAAILVETAAARIREETGLPPDRTSAVGQLIDLGFPFSLYEQAPFVGRGVPAITLTTAGDRPPRSSGDSTIDSIRLLQLGRSAQALLSSLDEGLEPAQGTSSYVYLGPRFVQGWAIELLLITMLLPFLVAVVDLFARCRRRRIAIAPAFRSYRSRLIFWLWVGGLFELFALAGVWPTGAARPINPESSAAGHWPRLGLLGLAILIVLSWFVGRDRLKQRRPITSEEELAGHAAVLLALGIVALLVTAVNPFALIFILPSLHAWLWMPQVRERPGPIRAVVLVLGFGGPFLLLGSFALRYGLGLDAPWYLAALTAVGYVPIVALIAVLAWAASAAQFTALAAGRYSPYPRLSERPPRGPIRGTVRAVVLAARARRRPVSEQQAGRGLT